MLDCLIKNVTAVTMDSREPVIHGANVGVSGEKITYVGTGTPDAKTAIDGKNRALIPGLVNAHTHCSMTAFRGWGDGKNLQDWLFDWIFPYEDRMTARQAAICAELCLAEAIAFGTAAVSDMYFFYEESADVFDRSGINANLTRALTGDEPGTRFEEYLELRERFGTDGRIRALPSVHAEYTSSPALWEKLTDISGLHVHISETRREHDECLKKYGKTPTALFDSHNLLQNALCAHGVWVTGEDLDILAARNASIAHCPYSNLKLASGVMPFEIARAKGVNIALGTDGTSSNDNMDMFEEIKLAATLHKGIGGDPTCVSSQEILRAATLGGARAMGRFDTGMIKEGFFADLTLIDLDKPHLFPRHDILPLLTYAAKGSDVCLTMARGRILYKDGQWLTIDVERVKREMETEVMEVLFK